MYSIIIEGSKLEYKTKLELMCAVTVFVDAHCDSSCETIDLDLVDNEYLKD